jgi:hypothetical protein
VTGNREVLTDGQNPDDTRFACARLHEYERFDSGTGTAVCDLLNVRFAGIAA